ncbi:hypothetical protein Anacy_5794 (plasmid) [Anabaena cylindrica PCC 7122]|uniref:Uncharacterized protein n=1 Tax=Anabaena cylindrica (strain ATCC 27899 / PCC 7122) TaxID=272123 RepID=K9ZRA7_ANACC|nr:hypothetical protein Anacy_5794 [Anabaena cylindrica PCC 7122]BAY06542.1 hypothetical protein NIES19_58250 [Anabaena cylindrica PCC 7122]
MFHLYLCLSVFICGQLFLIFYSMQLHINLVLDINYYLRRMTANAHIPLDISESVLNSFGELHKKDELLAAALVPSGTLRVARSRRVRYAICEIKTTFPPPAPCPLPSQIRDIFLFGSLLGTHGCLNNSLPRRSIEGIHIFFIYTITKLRL